MTAFGEVLRRDRKRQQISQTELAERVGVHQQDISHWETGKNSIGAENKNKLVAALGSQSELALNFDQIDWSATSPPSVRQRKWAGLTFEDMVDIPISAEWIHGARWAEAKLKEKNA